MSKHIFDQCGGTLLFGVVPSPPSSAVRPQRRTMPLYPMRMLSELMSWCTIPCCRAGGRPTGLLNTGVDGGVINCNL